MKYRIFIDSFSGEIADLKRGKRTRENMLAVLARSPLVSTWDMSEHRWLRDEIANMETDGLIISVDQPYPWLRYELTDKGRALLTPHDRVEGRDAASSRRVPSHDGLCHGAGETAFNIYEAPVGEGGGIAPSAGTTAPEGNDKAQGREHSERPAGAEG